MKINTALILCAGFGKRVNPITTNLPKPLIIYKDITLLENTINLLIRLKIKNIKINVFYLKEKIKDFIKNKKFPVKIEIVEDGEIILGTGGGTLNLMNSTDEAGAPSLPLIISSTERIISSISTIVLPSISNIHSRGSWFTIFETITTTSETSNEPSWLISPSETQTQSTKSPGRAPTSCI